MPPMPSAPLHLPHPPHPTASALAAARPLVTVLMAVHNAATYLRGSIDSILNQTFTDFEFLIYNDGSTDNTAAIVRSYSDPRVVLVDNPVNRSVSPNLNEGIERAQGRYLVRMDGDDIAYPERIARQVAYLEANPDVGLCGSAVRYIGASQAIIRLPQDNDVIQHTLWLQNAFYQPAVIIRLSVLREHNLRYDVGFEFAEDYKLWSDMSAVTKLHNLPEVLLDYRIHPHQISRRQSIAQQKVSGLIRKEQMNRLGIYLAPNQEVAFSLLTIEDDWRDFKPAEYEQVAQLLENLGGQARQLSIASEVAHKVIGEQWGRILSAARRYRPALIPYILRPSLYQHLPASIVLKLLTKCVVFWRPTTAKAKS